MRGPPGHARWRRPRRQDCGPRQGNSACRSRLLLITKYNHNITHALRSAHQSEEETAEPVQAGPRPDRREDSPARPKSRRPDLDIKKLEGEPFWRLRVGGWRVIFDRQDEVRIIAIEKIKPRGDAYK